MDKIKQALRDHPKAARTRLSSALPTVEAGQGAAPEVLQCGVDSTSPCMPSPAGAVATAMLPSSDMVTPTTPLAMFLLEQLQRRSLQGPSQLGARGLSQHLGFASALAVGAIAPRVCHYPLPQSNVGLIASGRNAMGGGDVGLISMLQSVAPLDVNNRQQLLERYLHEQQQQQQQHAVAALPSQQLYRALLLRRLRQGALVGANREVSLPAPAGNAGLSNPSFGTSLHNAHSGAGVL